MADAIASKFNQRRDVDADECKSEICSLACVKRRLAGLTETTSSGQKKKKKKRQEGKERTNSGEK